MALAEHKGRTTEELVARHIAPVKAEYWQASAKQALQIPSSTQGSPGEPATTVKKSIRQRKKARLADRSVLLCGRPRLELAIVLCLNKAHASPDKLRWTGARREKGHKPLQSVCSGEMQIREQLQIQS